MFFFSFDCNSKEENFTTAYHFFTSYLGLIQTKKLQELISKIFTFSANMSVPRQLSEKWITESLQLLTTFS